MPGSGTQGRGSPLATRAVTACPVHEKAGCHAHRPREAEATRIGVRHLPGLAQPCARARISPGRPPSAGPGTRPWPVVGIPSVPREDGAHPLGPHASLQLAAGRRLRPPWTCAPVQLPRAIVAARVACHAECARQQPDAHGARTPHPAQTSVCFVRRRSTLHAKAHPTRTPGIAPVVRPREPATPTGTRPDSPPRARRRATQAEREPAHRVPHRGVERLTSST